MFTDLSLDEVLHILNLIEKSDFDFLQLEAGDLKLTVSKTGFNVAFGDSQGAAVAAQPAAPSPAALKAEVKKAEVKKEPAPAKAKKVPVKEGTVPITAPMVGTFYTTPEPGAPPFVEAGQQVTEDTTVGLIEVMKVFNAVKSSVKGVIAEVCIENGQFVEYGQTLFLISPDSVLQDEAVE